MDMLARSAAMMIPDLPPVTQTSQSLGCCVQFGMMMWPRPERKKESLLRTNQIGCGMTRVGITSVVRLNLGRQKKCQGVS